MLPTVVKVEDYNGCLFDQKVIFEWIPPFCVKCGKAGHCCEAQKGKVSQKKVTQKWVIKEKQIPVEKEEHIVEGPGNLVTPVLSPVIVSSDKEEWSQVAKRKAGKQPVGLFSEKITLSNSIADKLHQVMEYTEAPLEGFSEG